MVEQATWLHHPDAPWPADAQRLYLGHETCEQRLPTLAAALGVAGRCAERGQALTLVTPLLGPAALRTAQELVDALTGACAALEVVCGDWGLLSWLSAHGHPAIAVGRLLAAQPTDPRHARLLADAPTTPGRWVQHLDGTLARLRRRPPSPALLAHLRSTWLDRPEVVAWLLSLGVRRGELSAVAQGVEIGRYDGWSWSLHVDDVLVTIQRRCDECAEPVRPCESAPQPWALGLWRWGNGWYYRAEGGAVAGVDRVVRRGAGRAGLAAGQSC